ncbi:MAG: type II secretion system minor pseudopilin GspI [Pseudomonadota bacterium]
MSNAKPKSQAGFSLVETIAAMGILALAAIPLLQISSDATRNSASLEARVLARMVAENIMTFSLAEPGALDAGIAVGTETQMGRAFAWSRTSGPASLGELQNLEVTVRREGDEQVLARLVALKYIPAALSSYSELDVEQPPSEEGDER